MTVRVELCVREESGGLEVTVSGLSPGESIVDSVDADAVVRLNETWNSLLSHFSGHGRSTGEMAEFGAAMSRALLSKPAAQSLSWLLTRSLDRRESFLLRLHLHAPLASGLPWELLNLEETGPIALCPNANVVRELCPDGSTETPPDTLRVLVAYANPATARFPYLAHADDEVLQLGELLGRERHRLDLERLPNAGPATLARMLRRLRPHMVHLIGHARRSPGGGEFVLQGGREEDLVGADELAEWLIGSGVRCVFLSACDTAGGVRALAETLVAAGVPSVIGMQSPVRDEVQTALVGEFYREMLRGKTLAESLSFARRSRRHDSGWWIPVLATRSPAARLVPPPPSEVDAQLPGNNLPLHDRPCVGRSAYLGELAGAVLHDGVRYVALCGIGGIGKTRLATELMTRLAPEFADGAWVVDCSAPESMDHVGAATAALFGARLTQADIAADLGEQLKAKQAMILFDSAEKFVPHGLRSFVERVCAKCPGLVCFVTSRVSLGWSADREIVLRPLSIPESDESGGEAIDMFVQVARASDRSLQISTEETGAVADICRLVDGIPLAIQLAAARLRHLSITELRDFVLANVTAALEDASSTSETRLSQVVDASIGALEATDVRTLARLTVFVGGFYLNDAAKVLEQTDPDMLNALVRLTSHSVLEVTRVGSKPRYRLLDIVGERARVLAGSDFLVEFAQADSTRHAQRYAELCAQFTKTGENLQTLSEWMWREIGNVRAAFGFAIEHELTPEISLFAQNLAVHFFEAGAWDDFQRLTTAGHAAAKRTGNDDLSVRLLGLEGALAGRRGRSDECVALWTERLECARRSGNLAAEADSLTDLGTVAFQAGDYAEAERLVTEALTPAEKAERFDLVATVYIMRGLICAETGRGEEALRWAREAQTAASRATGSPLIFVFTNLGRVFLTCGAAEEAEAAYGLALKLASSGKRHFHIQGALLGLSKTREAQGDDEGSARCLIAAKKLGGQIESRRTVDADERLKNVRTKLAGTAGSAVFDELASQPWERIVAEIVAQLGS